jgi:hypothetical protein
LDIRDSNSALCAAHVYILETKSTVQKRFTHR